MNKISDEMYIKVPRKLIYEDYEDNEIKGGVLLLYSYIYRFSTRDGFFKGSIQEIANNCGSHYDVKSERTVTKFVKTLAKCIKILERKNIINIQNQVNENDLITPIFITFNENYLRLDSKFVSITFSQFDYLIKINSRDNKCLLFMLLFWILNCSSKMKSGQIIDACAFSINYMIQATGLNEMTILKYLSKLCGEPGSSAPLIKTKTKTVNIQGQFRRFPNIYVKNDKDFKDTIKNEMIFLNEKFRQGNTFEYEFDDLDGLFE